MNLRVIRAVAARDLGRVRGQQRGRGMLGLALALVVPLAALPCAGGPVPASTHERARVVAGAPPAEVLAVAQLDPSAAVSVWEGPPVRVAAHHVPQWLRVPLDAHTGGPTVSIVRDAPAPFVPGRNLWVLLLAASLLTGPLVESVPGERAQRTWETLRSAPITGRELLLGKWAAWTLSSLAVALTGVAAGLLSGTQSLGLPLLGLPLVLGAVVALGLWLLRNVDDPAGGATIPVRVIPLVLLFSGGLSYVLVDGAPLLAGAVPFGGALLLAAGAPHAGWVAAGAVASTLGLVAALMVHGAATLDRPARSAGRASAAAGPLLAALIVWWTAILAPHAWEAVGSVLRPPPGPSALAAGLGLGIVAMVANLRDPAPPPGVAVDRSWVGWALAVAAGAALAVVDAGVPSIPSTGPLREAMLGPPMAPVLPAIVCAVGQEVLFRGAVARRAGPWIAAAAWALMTRTLDPAVGLFGGVALGFLYQRGGLPLTITAHVVWVLVAGVGLVG